MRSKISTGFRIRVNHNSTGSIFLLQDEFVTPKAAPLVSPRVCEPGPGTLTIVDTTNLASILNGQLVFSGFAANNDPGFAGTNLIARVSGRTLKFALKTLSSSAIVEVGLLNSIQTTAGGIIGARRFAVFINSNVFFISGATSFQVRSGLINDIDYPCAIIMRTIGHFVLTSISGAWCLLWFEPFESTANFSIFGGNYANFPVSLNYLRLYDLSGALATDFGIATIHDIAPVSGTPQTGEANGISDLYFTLAGAPVANQIGVQMDYRRQDASNYWSAYIKRNAANTAWDFFLDIVTAGIPTNRITATGVGVPTLVRVIHDGNTHNCYTAVGGTWTKRGGEVSNASFATSVNVVPIAGAGGTISELDVWPYRSALFNVLD